MKTVTFFLGAGFSKAAGYPIGKDLNSEMKKFIENGPNPSVFPNEMARYLLREYEESKSEFNYEEFYDYLISYGIHVNIKRISKEKIQKFEKTFNYYNRVDSIIAFERAYNEKLYEIFKKVERNENHCQYKSFIEFIEFLISKDFHINIISLNHDRLIENLFKENCISYSDGFDYDVKCYQYKLRGKNKIWNYLFHFTGQFKNNLNLIKLHGSVDLYYVAARENDSVIYLKPEKDEKPASLFYSKIKDCKSKMNFDITPLPQFLTGKLSKYWFKDKLYFKDIFGSLDLELQRTDLLIFIGYGFMDEYINEDYLEKVFKNKTEIHVIDIKFDNEFLTQHEVVGKKEGGLEKVSLSEFKALIHST